MTADHIILNAEMAHAEAQQRAGYEEAAHLVLNGHTRGEALERVELLYFRRRDAEQRGDCHETTDGITVYHEKELQFAPCADNERHRIPAIALELSQIRPLDLGAEAY